MKKKISIWVLTVPLAALFVLAGAAKFGAEAVENFQRFGYSGGFRVFIGIAELAGAVGLLVPRLAFWAAAGLVAIMAGAVYTHLAVEISPAFPAGVGGLLVVLGILRHGDAWLLSSRSAPDGLDPRASSVERPAT